MGALPRPDLAPGPHSALVDALHDLHHRAGWPSLRTLARDAGCSHTTVSNALSSPRLPAWGIVEVLVEAMDGDVPTFHDLWLAASAPSTNGTAPMPRIAGRRTELDAVRRHLETGTGLLLVTGEAGMGKTKLVTTTRAITGTFVATGSCLPLSSAVPLLPIADILREVYRADQGQWVKEALADAAPYVATSLARLLPELMSDAMPREPDDEWSRQRLFAAVGVALTGLVALRPLAVLIEDLHWADNATLDLLEHLLVSGTGVPILGTWRTGDATIPRPMSEWLARVRRCPGFRELPLGPLTKGETAEQLALLSSAPPDPRGLERIHARSQGQPLFTEQLALASGSGAALPTVLADLLDTRMAGLGETAWAIARALGVADRPLSAGLLRRTVDLPTDEITAGLRELGRHGLLDTTQHSDDVRLRHPLLAEAARRRLVPGEGSATHRNLAEVLGAETDASPAEVATHWQGAGDAARELEWRITAARASGARWASASEAEQWLRALEIWPESVTLAGKPPLSRAEVYLAAIDALTSSLQFSRAAGLSDEAQSLFPHVDAHMQAEILSRAAYIRPDREGLQEALVLIDQALDLFAGLPPGPGMVLALDHRREFLVESGRYSEAFVAARRAADVAEQVGDPRVVRYMLNRVAWHEGITGSVEQAARTMARSRRLLPPGVDPRGDIAEAVIWTDVLLQNGAGSEEVEAAGRDGIRVAEEWGLENFYALVVRANVALALSRDGRVADAAAYVDPITEGPIDLDRSFLHLVRSLLDALRGELDRAEARASLLWQGSGAWATTDVDFVAVTATIDLWNRTPDRALRRLVHMLDAWGGSAPSVWAVPAMTLAARAAADSVRPGSRDALELRDSLSSLHSRARQGPSAPHTTSAAENAMWSAELARLVGTETVEHWVHTAIEWDRHKRPHDAAYCRWRAAQVALREGQGTVAARLLKRAASDAREHVPLRDAIAGTLAG